VSGPFLDDSAAARNCKRRPYPFTFRNGAADDRVDDIGHEISAN
jgi:hypothetical protein